MNDARNTIFRVWTLHSLKHGAQANSMLLLLLLLFLMLLSLSSPLPIPVVRVRGRFRPILMLAGAQPVKRGTGECCCCCLCRKQDDRQVRAFSTILMHRRCVCRSCTSCCPVFFSSRLARRHVELVIHATGVVFRPLGGSISAARCADWLKSTRADVRTQYKTTSWWYGLLGISQCTPVEVKC